MSVTIGYLTNDLFNSYNCTIWQGIHDACARGGVRVLYFIGGEISSPVAAQSMRNRIYHLARQGVVDGLVVNATSLFEYLDADGIRTFMAQFDGIPVVTHGARFGDAPAVLVDNESGVREGVIHLVQEHSRRAIACISGPRLNAESIERCRAYGQALEELGLVPDPELVEDGDFSEMAGAVAFERLLAKGKPIDAVVCMNDDMARGVMSKAQELGIDIPDGLSVIGFDDTPYARSLLVPLSTVQQPLHAQGEKAAGMLIELVGSGRPPDSVVLPARFIVRRSCGCFNRSLFGPASPPSAPGGAGRAADKGGIDEILHRAFRQSMTAPAPDHVLQDLEKRMTAEAAAGRFEASEWQDALWRVFGEVSLDAKAQPSALIGAEGMFNRFRTLIQDIGINQLGYAHAVNEQRTAALRNTNMELISSYALEELFDVMWRRLPRADVEACWLVLYDVDPESRYSRLMFGFSGAERVPIPEKGIVFETAEILPPEIKARHALDDYIIEALFFRDEHFGYILMRTRPQRILFNMLWQQIAGSLKGSLLLQSVREKEKTLEILLADQRTRAAELEAANRELEAFSYSVSHDLRAPLRAMDGFARILMADHAGGLTAQGARILEKISENARQMSRLVDGLLSFSRFSRQAISPQPVPMDKLVAEVIESQRPHMEDRQVAFSVGDLPVSLGDPTLLRQVWTNLISNALKFTRGRDDARIEIGVCEADGEPAYFVKDNGVGFDMKYADKLFGVFQRLHSAEDYEGTGIGLATVQRIIHRHGGRVWATAEPGRGAVFYFTV